MHLHLMKQADWLCQIPLVSFSMRPTLTSNRKNKIKDKKKKKQMTEMIDNLVIAINAGGPCDALNLKVLQCDI